MADDTPLDKQRSSATVKGKSEDDMALSVTDQLREIQRGTVDIIPLEELKRKLETGRRLRIKLGVDPTSRICTSATPWWSTSCASFRSWGMW